MSFRTPMVSATSKSYMIVLVFLSLVKDALTEYSYFSSVAGAGYSLTLNEDGFNLMVYGFNDKLYTLLETILIKIHPNPQCFKDDKKVVGFKTDHERFAVIVEQLTREFKNFENENPDSHASSWTEWIFKTNKFTNDEKLLEIKLLKPADIDTFIPHLFSNVIVDSLIHGNITDTGAQQLPNLFDRIWKIQPLPLSKQLEMSRSYEIPYNTSIIFEQIHPSKENPNSAVEYSLQIGHSSQMVLRANLAVFGQIASEPAFNQLRTKEQLGYSCFAKNNVEDGIMWYKVYIQGEHDPMYVESRIEDFLSSIRTLIEEMSESAFTTNILAVRTSLLETDKQMYSETFRYWSAITDQHCDFHVPEKLAEFVSTVVTKETVLELFDKFIKPFENNKREQKNENRRKLSVHVRSRLQNDKTEDEKKEIDQVIEKNDILKTEREILELRSLWRFVPLINNKMGKL
ncbi:Insulinase (Peptidase M16), partial [Nowakowskiella sp. JEL0078]